ncbi:Tensin-3 [Fasciola gigantica]|uniref:Tensin-3 n=1 Tax=Fasciola gigantica TaxID=46835 RepID=A0A504YQV1_FASGI|nr:Tensin-3 [Fasciola gigantica]
MAGTQELDRLLEELRLTSMNMASGLPPIGSQFSSASQYYSPKTHSTSGYPRGSTPPVHQTGYLHQQQQQQQRHSESRFYTTRSASAIGSHSNLDHGPFSYNGTSFNTQPTGYNYLKQSSYHTERRIDNLNKPTSQYPSYRSLYSPIPSQRHHSIYTTTLKPRTPMGPRQLSQIHLTIDPECGTAEATQGPTSLLVNDQGSSRREQLLESELNSARQELAQLRRAISLVDERRHATRHEELSSRLSPSRLPQSRSPGPIHHQQQQQLQQQQQFMSKTTSSYHSQQHGQRSSSTFQRAHPRQDTTTTCHQIETETFVSHHSSGLRLDSKKKTHSDVVRRKPLRSCGYQQLGSAQTLTPVQSPSASRFSHFDYEGRGSMNRKNCRADCVPRSPIHRRQNCHGSSCHYCLSDNTGSLISNCCALDADSGSSTDKEDQYPSIYVANNAKRMTQSYHEQGNNVARDQEPEVVSEEETMNSKRNTGVSHVIPIIVGSRTPVRKELQVIHEPTSLRQSSYNQDFSSAALYQRIPSTYNQQEQCQRQQQHRRRDQMRSQSHATVTTMCTNTITENAHYIPVTSERKIPIRSKPRQVTIDQIPITFIHEPMIQGSSPSSHTATDLSSDHQPRSPVIPAQRLKMDQDYSPQTRSVRSPVETAQNVQLMRADRPPVVVSVSYLPRSESRSQGEDGASAESSSISPRLSGRSRYPAESDLAVRRVTSVSSSAGRSSYSAHRERIRQEREQELLMRQQQMQRQRQMAASTTGLHEHSLQHQSRHQQQYRSLSAVNQNGGSEAFEEIETIILQPIGRGVQDIDSRVGSMTTLARAPGGSLIDGSGRQASPSRSTFQHQNASLRSDSAHPQLFAGSRIRTPSPAVVAHEKVDNHPPSTTRTLTRGADPRAYPLRYQRSLPEQIHQHNQPYHSEHRVQQHQQTKSYLDRPMRPDTRTGTPKIPTSTESHSETHFATSFRTPIGSPAVGRRTKALANQPDDISHPSIRQYTPDQSVMDDSEFAILGTDDNKRHLVTSSATEQAAGFSTPLLPTTGHIPRNQHAKSSKRTEHQPVEELGQLQVEVIEPEPRQHPRSPAARQTHEAVANISPKPALHVDAPFPSGLHRVDDGQRSGLTRRGFSSTHLDITEHTCTHSHLEGTQTIGASRFGTVSATPQMSGSRSQLSTTSSTIIAPASAAPIPITNGWKTEPTKSAFSDVADGANNLSIVQETAPAWYRPTLSREAAISILRQQPPGSFLIRDSTTFKDAFGLAVKVATLPPKVTPKSDDLQSELVRHYLIEVVNAPNKGVRLKGFASEPVFASLAALIHQHTIDPLALPCRLILPPIPAHIPSSGTAALPAIVIGSSPTSHVLPTNPQTLADLRGPMDHTTVTSGGSVLCGGAPSESGSAQIDGLSANAMNSVTPVTRVDGGTSSPITNDGIPTASSPNVPFVCVLHENPPEMEGQLSQGLTFRCLMLGSVDTPQWSMEMCFSRAVDQLIPLTLLTAADCDRGVSRVRYTEVQLHVSSHDGITIIDLQRRLFLRRHLPNHVLMYCGIETRKKEIFGIVVRKGISECTTHIFTECDPIHTTDSIVRHIRETYPHMNVR